MVKVISAAATLSILIAALGLFCISYILINKRINEIGIRKVNGASITEIIQMLNLSFVKWIAIAFVIATPIAYYGMEKWLANFAYQTTLSWWIFLLSGVLTMAIVLITFSKLLESSWTQGVRCKQTVETVSSAKGAAPD